MAGPTITDVAKAAGVAASTVSRALSNPGRVSAQTRQRIEAVARDLGYAPHARVRTKTIAVVVADIANPFYFDLIRGSQRQLRAADYTQLLVDTEESAELEADLIERMRPNIDGVILAASRLTDRAIAELAATLPVVVVNRQVPNVPTVIMDAAPGIDQAIEHLVSLGHGSLAYIAGPDRSWANLARWKAITVAAGRHAMTPVRLGPFAPNRTSGTAAADALVTSGATAAIAYNDLIAIGMLTRLGERGIRVPEDVSILGCDDIFGADFASPTLTTITAPIEQAGRVAVTLLLGSLESRPGGRRAGVLLPTHLTVRNSTRSKTMTMLSVNADRLFPADPATRDVARRLYAEVATAPILSPHGHVDAQMLLDDEPFSDPSALLITPDHYVTRLLHANGVPLERLRPPTPPREIWNELVTRWHLFAGTPVRCWLESQFAQTFGGVDIASSDSYDRIAETLATPEFRPRALYDRFGIRVLATTDDPADDLAAHRELQAKGLNVIPTFRADRYLTPSAPGWTTALDELAEASGFDTALYAGLLGALRSRREFFKGAGATSTDSGVPDAWAEPLGDDEAERIHSAGRAGTVTEAEAIAYRRNLLYRFAEMSTEDGLVMQLHPSVVRNHHAPTLAAFGPDTGHDLPDAASFTRPLRRLLNDFGTHPNLHLVLFTVDETAFSREIGPLAGFYPTVFAGAPWWFLDSPAGIARYRAAITDSAGLYKTSGFIDDTRAFCSIPARHDMSRRLDAGFLAGLVTTHQLDEGEAAVIAKDLVTTIPAKTFRLERFLSR